MSIPITKVKDILLYVYFATNLYEPTSKSYNIEE